MEAISDKNYDDKTEQRGGTISQAIGVCHDQDEIMQDHAERGDASEAGKIE